MAMNRGAAIDEFVSKNLKLLTSTEFERRSFKDAQRKYFYEKHGNKHGTPSLSEVLIVLVQLLRKRGTSTAALNDMFDRLPAFRLVGDTQAEELRRQIVDTAFQSTLSQDQLDTIRKVGAFEALEIQKGSEIEARKAIELRELERQIEEKRQEYDQLPSVLEQSPVEEPEFNPEAEAVKQWWERFYLRENPFRRKDGLDAIDRNLYDAVILRTKPLVDAIGLLTRDPFGMFGTASLLLGDYGFGKTTFIDYLSYYLATKNIAAIRITSGRPHADADGFIDDFYVRLRSSFRSELRAGGQSPESGSDDATIDSQVVSLAQKLIESGRLGIIIFLDDYHKHRSALPAIYEFLGTLQILKDEFARHGVKCGFIVAGLPEWRRQIPSNSQMTGFLDGPIYEMPPITPESVTAVFNQRIRAFCYDTNIRELKLQYVKHIFQGAGKSSGYRDYLTKIIGELENNNYAIVNTPIEITEEKLNDVRLVIESDPALKSSFNKLVYESKFKNFNREQVAKCVELLVQTSLQNGIGENDVLFLDSTFYFGRLRDLGLIQKRKEGVGKAFKWVIHYRLQGKLDQIQHKYNFGINDYLLKLYAYKGYGGKPAHEIPLRDGPLVEARKFLNRSELKINKSARESIGVAFHAYDAAIHAARTGPSEEGVVPHCIRAFEAISNALFEIDGTMPYFHRAGVLKISHRWQSHWLADESVSEFFGRTDRYDKTKSAADATHTVRSLETILLAVTDRMKQILDDVTDATVSVGLFHNLSQHTQAELSLFDRVRTDYFSTDSNAHFEYVKAMTDYLEERFRWFLYVTTTAVFGKEYFAQVPGGQTRQYAYKNLTSRESYSVVENMYHGLTRPQFRQIFTGGSIKSQIIDGLGLAWQTVDWDKFFEIFVERNIETAHHQRQAFSASDRSAYVRYVQMAEQLLAAINRTVSKMLVDDAYIMLNAGSIRPVEACGMKFCFRVKESREHPMPPNHQLREEHARAVGGASAEPVKIERAAYDRFREFLLAKLDATEDGTQVEELMDVEYLVSHYNLPFLEFMAALAYMYRAEEIIRVLPWIGGAVLIKRQ